MHKLIPTLILLAIVKTSSEANADFPVVTLEEIREIVVQKKVTPDKLSNGGKLSAFAVSDISEEYTVALESFMIAAPLCINASNYPTVNLTGGSVRSTYATTTKTYPECLGKETMKTLSSTFDLLEKLVTELVEVVVDKELKYYHNNKEEVTKLADSPHKDHLHVYRNKKEAKDEKMEEEDMEEEDMEEKYLVPYHVDNGIFLLLTPTFAPSLEIMTESGETVTTATVPSNSILVLFGRGLTDWLLLQEDTREAFYSAPHGVKNMKKDRAVYARMKVAPAEAKPGTREEEEEDNLSQTLFGDIFAGHYWQDGQLCSTNISEEPFFTAMTDNCAEGDAFCWMGCYPLPSECPSVKAARCFSRVTNITCSTEVDGSIMDQTCRWECKESNNNNYPISDYCNGRMDMLMFGFKAAGNKHNPCIILFFEAWTLDTRLKFCIACLGVAMLGFAIEAMIAFRRSLSSGRRLVNLPRKVKKLLMLVMFGLNLVLGYLAMLVAMTYSVELFCSTVVGLVVGHGCLNMGEGVRESADPCCAASELVKEKEEVVLLLPQQQQQQQNMVVVQNGKTKCCGKNKEEHGSSSVVMIDEEKSFS